MTFSYPNGHADIGYMPNYDKYLARGKRRQENEKLDKQLPKGFPSSLSGDLVWDANSLVNKYDWNYQLTAEDLDEINNALRHFKLLNKPMGELSPDTFPLPKLHAVLREISNEVHNGRGFKVIRGLPVDSYTREENVIIYAGLSSHVAPIRGRQDNKWQGRPADVLVAHVKDLSQSSNSKDIPGPVVTADKQVFHTDAGDVIALFCLSESESGGESYLASTCHVYNVLAATRPDLIKTLSEPWPFDDFAPAGDQYKLRPLLYYQPATDADPERLIIQYSRRNLTGYMDCKRSANIPPLTEAQAEALDAVHFTAEREAISLDFHKGDIQFANNLSILHARGAFTDSKLMPVCRRHLLRLWLRDPEYEWTKALHLKERFDRVYAGVTVENSVFPLEATIRSSNVAT
ncbi:TfdA family taurine catabolism dioxygenase TauD [Xylona heveae TC161]|uniref:TfdA family taurine catabolism dioxygenase TauD n=1 Tax=Xylona heveae (strain CBS 132557 / TC161) TaxID=1328760 RepID=A0A161TDI2_XYLHT|nr:TfdA family taurine catabolism dioxygenase TauD [Xylona heveae TC161]KZF23907.1 TfdA family taurine catabolism dioxygenase TauD [Xylona heveae TC161]